jgi:RHS repeat-associated protein
LRSVVRLVDWDAHDFLRVDYDSWGKGSATGKLAAAEPFRYRGGFEDHYTGLLNFGARWYDSSAGRWLSADPLLTRLVTGGEDVAPSFAEILNLYAYVRNNPLTLFDPDGLGGVLPKGWPPPPDWKGGYKWKNTPDGNLEDRDGERWHWHEEDETHNEHWDYGTGRDKRRLDRKGKDLGDDAFKEDKPKEETSDTEQSDKNQTAKRVIEGAAAGAITVSAGVILWEVGKWGLAILLAPETAGASLGAAAVMP